MNSIKLLTILLTLLALTTSLRRRQWFQQKDSDSLNRSGRRQRQHRNNRQKRQDISSSSDQESRQRLRQQGRQDQRQDSREKKYKKQDRQAQGHINRREQRQRKRSQDRQPRNHRNNRQQRDQDKQVANVRQNGLRLRGQDNKYSNKQKDVNQQIKAFTILMDKIFQKIDLSQQNSNTTSSNQTQEKTWNQNSISPLQIKNSVDTILNDQNDKDNLISLQPENNQS